MSNAPLLDYPSDYDPLDSEEDEYGFVEVPRDNEPETPAVDPFKELCSRIQTAASKGDLLELREALTDNKLEFTVDTRLDGNWTALMYACSASQPQIVNFLLEQGADPNINANAMTPLLCACLSKTISEISNAACINSLLKKNVTVNISDRYRQTPLMIAIETGKNHLATMLIPYANLEMTDSQGRTALFYAVNHNRDEILRQLIKAGASLEVYDNQRLNIKDLALNKNHQPTLLLLKEFLRNAEKLEMDSNEISYELLTDWKDMYPGILSMNQPAYWFEIPRLLYGMQCEKLIPIFDNAKVDLFTFLTMTEDDMNKLNINMPYLRNRLQLGLLKFHLHRWNIDTVLGYPSKPGDQVDFVKCLNYFASHMEQVTVMKASFNYLNNAIKAKKFILTEEFEVNIEKTISQNNKVKMELEKSKEIIQKINKLTPAPADLIKPLQKSCINKKKLFYLTILAAVCVTASLKLKHA